MGRRQRRSRLDSQQGIAYLSHAPFIDTMTTARFFSDLRGRLDDGRHANLRAIGQLFAHLSPQLATARRLELELDRQLARRFNVLDYLRTDELGLSRIIADLLDPYSAHDQGVFFLRKLLLALKELTQFDPGVDLESCQISVTPEQKTTANRKIDIVVEIVDERSKYALAIENKPYAGDRKHQVRDYLRYLRDQYGQNFLLFYLSPTGDGPSEWSVSRQELHANWTGRFAILPYHRQPEAHNEDAFEAFRLPYSLTEWLDACRAECSVDRLSWFLGDTLQFCQRTFGEQTMTSDRETQAVRQFLFENPDHVDTAIAVYESWPPIRDQVCEKFLERLRSRIETADELKPYASDLQVGCQYRGQAKYSNVLWLYRNRWQKYEGAPAITGQRTAIRMESEGPGPKGWHSGVCSPISIDKMEPADRQRRERFEGELNQAIDLPKRSPWWPKWDYLDATAHDWNKLVPDLHRECEGAEDGEITRHIVDAFVGVAVRAIPILDELD